MRTRESYVSSNLVPRRGCVTRSARHSFCCLLLTTSQTIQLLRHLKMTLKSLLWKILPLTLTRSRLCAPFFKASEWFQDFACQEGGGGTSAVAPGQVQSRVDVSCYQSDNIRRPAGTHACISSLSSPAPSPSCWARLSPPLCGVAAPPRGNLKSAETPLRYRVDSKLETRNWKLVTTLLLLSGAALAQQTTAPAAKIGRAHV